MRTQRTRVLVEIALCIALASWLAVQKVPLPWNIAGGSISLSMLPIFIISLRRGLLVGLVTGALFGVMDYFLEPWFVHPVQVALDYGIAFAACGVAGIGARLVHAAAADKDWRRTGLLTVPFVFVGALGRFAASFVSGIVFFAANAPEGQPVWLYSALYNLSYIVPSLVACAVLTALIVPALERAAPSVPSVNLSRA